MGVTVDKIVDAAAEIIDDDDATFSLARLARDLGVKTPSLYSHVDGLDHVKRLLKLRGLQELADQMQRAAMGRSARDALAAIADAQRSYATEHPGLFAYTRRVSADDGPDVEQAGHALLDIVLAVVRGYGMKDDDALHAARILHASTRGFIELELSGSFEMAHDVDESWRRLIDILDRGLAER
jgi:AcrR family transcriptional regulator